MARWIAGFSCACCAAFTLLTWARPLAFALEPVIVGGEPWAIGATSATAIIGDCDATLVADDLLLTAAHCVVEAAPERAWFGRSLDQAVTSAAIAYCEAYPDYPWKDGTDIAYCVLDESVTDIEPALLESDCSLDVTQLTGAELVLRGHGYTTAERLEERIERAVAVRVAEMRAEGRELVVGDREHGACNGDSGGSAYLTLPDGEVELVGVISRRGPSADGALAANCESTTIVTRVAPYLAWFAASTGIILSTTCDSTQPTAAVVDEARATEPFSAAAPRADAPDSRSTLTPSCSLAPHLAVASAWPAAWLCIAWYAIRRARARSRAQRALEPNNTPRSFVGT